MITKQELLMVINPSGDSLFPVAHSHTLKLWLSGGILLHKMTELEERTYLYRNHIGGDLYTSDEIYDLDNLYCEACGDYDGYLGSFQTVNEFWNLVKDEDYDIHYLFTKIVDIFDLPYSLIYSGEVGDEFYKICCNSTRYIADKLKELLGDNFEWNEELWGEIK